jgi:hypothetical protein
MASLVGPSLLADAGEAAPVGKRVRVLDAEDPLEVRWRPP